MFTSEDLQQIESLGIDLQIIRKQIDHFISGFPYIRLARPATAGDGIMRFDDAQIATYLQYYEKHAPGLMTVKFVPASGAASRMFKHLFEFRDSYSPGAAGEELLLKDQTFNSVYFLLNHLRKIAFYNDLEKAANATGNSVEQLVNGRDFRQLMDLILSESGLNYTNLPKGLIKFHSYPEGARTAAEEHLVEAAAYATGLNGQARIHFTISPEHREKFMALFLQVTDHYESAFSITFDISYSIQRSSTDTIAVGEDNQPLRNPDGRLLFRPGGHGALLDNLNDIDADLIFIKNIDNIVPDRLKETTVIYKKLLGGYLLYLKEIITEYLIRLTNNQVGIDALKEIVFFAREKLLLDLPGDFDSLPSDRQTAILIDRLDRPMRVCGMVKNEGEPGGGPFWVYGDDGQVSLQIVESSQIDLADPAQKAVAGQATHFNPVDLVCSTRSFTGQTFDLKCFVDENTGFISRKSTGGKTLKAQELPGLWNGAMAGWITIFVEVPVITFNPVKIVNDLLRPEHLAE